MIRAAAIATLLLAAPSLAAERVEIFDLAIGTPVEALPDAFVDYACGTNGGPPGRPLSGFAAFADCPADATGLHEVYFRYDDELEYVGRALDQAYLVEAYRGTRVEGVDAMVSVLIDDGAMLRGLRIATDPRGVLPGDRNDHWRLADLLRNRFGAAAWTCTDLPPSEGETPVGTFFIKRSCEMAAQGLKLSTYQDYLHRPGQHFIDEFGKVAPTYFISTSRFDMREALSP